jgi:hypothetical protein
MSEIEMIAKRLDVLEKNFNAFLKAYNNDKKYDGYDKNGLRNTDGIQGEAIEVNSSDVEDVRLAVEEVYEMIIDESEGE